MLNKYESVIALLIVSIAMFFGIMNELLQPIY